MLTAQIAAEYFESKTREHLARNEDLWRKIKKPRDFRSIGGIADRLDVLFSRPPQERKPNATLCIAGPGGRRAIIELLPGRPDGQHNPRHSRALSRALQRVRRPAPTRFLDPYPYFRYLIAKITWVSECGDIHDLTESDDEECQISWIAYNSNIWKDNHIPFPDLSLSDYNKKDIYFRSFANYLDVEPFQKIRPAIQTVYKCRVFIEPAKNKAGVVRVYPIGNVDHLTEHPKLLTSGEGLTELRYGFSVHDEVGKPLDFDLLKLFNNTHAMTLGASGSGKTNDIGNKLYRIKLMTKAPKEQRIVGRCIFVDSEKGATGLDMYMGDGIECVTEPKEIREKFLWLHDHYSWRVAQMKKWNLTNWPIGETRIDDKGKERRCMGTILMVDETTELLKKDWLLPITDPDENDEDDVTIIKKRSAPKGMKIVKLFEYWSRVFRATGILMMLYAHKARVIDGVPSALTDNCLLKQMFHIEDDDQGPEFFNCSANKFALPATEFDRGYCVIKAPWESLDYFYAKTEKAPHEIEQAKLRIQRGY